MPASERASREQFEAGLRCFREFVAAQGHGSIPQRYVCPVHDFAVGRWLNGRRSRRDTLPDWQIKLLEAEEQFSWEVRDSGFAQRVAELGAATKRAGRLPMKNEPMGQFLNDCRRFSKKGALPVERRRLLDEQVPGWDGERQVGGDRRPRPDQQQPKRHGALTRPQRVFLWTLLRYGPVLELEKGSPLVSRLGAAQALARGGLLTMRRRKGTRPWVLEATALGRAVAAGTSAGPQYEVGICDAHLDEWFGYEALEVALSPWEECLACAVAHGDPAAERRQEELAHLLLDAFPRRATGGTVEPDPRRSLGVRAQAGQHTAVVAVPPLTTFEDLAYDLYDALGIDDPGHLWWFLLPCSGKIKGLEDRYLTLKGGGWPADTLEGEPLQGDPRWRLGRTLQLEADDGAVRVGELCVPSQQFWWHYDMGSTIEVRCTVIRPGQA